MNIQQAFNQALYQAQIGAGLYKQSPEAKERAELKKEETAAKGYERALADYEETHQYLSPEELPEPKEKEREEAQEAAEGLYNIAKARYLREPSHENWETKYLRGVEADEYARQGGTSAYINKLKKNKPTTVERTQERLDTINNQEMAFRDRRQFLEQQTDPFKEGLWQRGGN